MAITRAQIPEQIDVFNEGGDVTSSLTPEDIIALYGAQQSAPTTAEDIQAQAKQIAGLFPQTKKQNIYDLASAVGAGLVGSASDPRGFGAGLTAGFQSFNARTEKIQAEKDKIRQEIALLAYKQVEAKRKEQLETSNEVLKMQFKNALVGAGGVDFGSSERGRALAFIASAERKPSLKTVPDPENPGKLMTNPDYTISLLIARQERLVNTDQGTIRIPGIDIDAAFPQVQTLQPVTIDGIVYKPVVGEFEAGTGKQIYENPNGQKGALNINE